MTSPSPWVLISTAPTEAVYGTSMQGYVETTYSALLTLLGDPIPFPGDKATVEWHLTFANGEVATVYDWKMPATPTTGTYRWHVGGRSPACLQGLQRLLGASAQVLPL